MNSAFRETEISYSIFSFSKWRNSFFFFKVSGPRILSKRQIRKFGKIRNRYNTRGKSNWCSDLTEPFVMGEKGKGRNNTIYDGPCGLGAENPLSLQLQISMAGNMSFTCRMQQPSVGGKSARDINGKVCLTFCLTQYLLHNTLPIAVSSPQE